MEEKDIAKWVRTNIQPLNVGPNVLYRCAAVLTDGLYLPCVAVQRRKTVVKRAVRRFAEARGEICQKPFGRASLFGRRKEYRSMVDVFVAAGNRVNYYDIAHLELSDYALPLARMQEIKGETRMGWTEFTVTMSDGTRYSFGTTFLQEFFHMPEGYKATDVVQVDSYGTVGGPIYRERPYFVCFVNGV